MNIADKKLPHAHSVFFSLVLPVGAVREEEEKAGITHLIEHLCFRRTQTLGQREIYRFFEQRGANVNAVTGKNFLWFYFSAGSDVFEEVLRLFYDMFHVTAYTIEDVKAEKKIITGEAEGFEKTNDSIILDSLWSDAAFSKSVLGSVESLNNISLSDVSEYKKELLSLSGTVFLCGSFTAAQRALTEELFGGDAVAPPVSAPSASVPPPVLAETACESARKKERNIVFVRDKYKLCDVYYAFTLSLQAAERERTQEILCLQMLESALFEGNTAYITAALREEFGIYNVDSRLECLGNEAVFLFSFKAENSNICAVTEKLERLLREFVFDARYYEYIKAFYCDNVGMLCDDPQIYAENWTDNYILFGEPMTPEEKAEKIARIPSESSQAVYRKMLQTKKSWFFGKISFGQRRKLRKLSMPALPARG